MLSKTVARSRSPAPGPPPTTSVVFTSAQSHPAPGDWGGIDYQPGSSGSISYTSLDYAGAPMLNSHCGALYNNCGTNAALLIEGANSPNVSVVHSHIENSAANGIEVTSEANPTLAADTFGYCGKADPACPAKHPTNGGTALQFDSPPLTLAQDSGLA